MSGGYKLSEETNWEPDWALWDSLMRPPSEPFVYTYPLGPEVLRREKTRLRALVKRNDRQISNLLVIRRDCVNRLKTCSGQQVEVKDAASSCLVDERQRQLVKNYILKCVSETRAPVFKYPNPLCISHLVDLQSRSYLVNLPHCTLVKIGLLRKIGRALRYFLGFSGVELVVNCIGFFFFPMGSLCLMISSAVTFFIWKVSRLMGMLLGFN